MEDSSNVQIYWYQTNGRILVVGFYDKNVCVTMGYIHLKKLLVEVAFDCSHQVSLNIG